MLRGLARKFPAGSLSKLFRRHCIGVVEIERGTATARWMSHTHLARRGTVDFKFSYPPLLDGDYANPVHR